MTANKGGNVETLILSTYMPVIEASNPLTRIE